MRTVVSLLALVALLGACGYKGPLYLPKPKPEAPAKPAPPADDTKKATDVP
ncbi:MAG: LPS translocon maturation chaperone LptM [Betaproteobacteria bacterium]